MTVVVEYAPGAAESGFASMIGALVEQNAADHADKRDALARMWGRIALVAEDADVALTLEFRSGVVRVHDGIAGIPDITLRAGFEDITNLSRVESITRFELPDPRGQVAREVWRALRERRIRIHGALTNLPLMLRFSKVMSI